MLDPGRRARQMADLTLYTNPTRLCAPSMMRVLDVRDANPGPATDVDAEPVTPLFISTRGRQSRK
jgi:hypothetical protein